jgi:hypothetical protein
VKREIDEELRFHMEQRTAAKMAAALLAGVSLASATEVVEVENNR